MSSGRTDTAPLPISARGRFRASQALFHTQFPDAEERRAIETYFLACIRVMMTEDVPISADRIARAWADAEVNAPKVLRAISKKPTP